MITSNFSRIFFSFLLISIISFGCKKEDPNETTNNDLAGNWDVTSFTLDGVELIGASLNSFEMEYKQTSEFGGETEWLLVDILGASTRAEGDYTIQNEGLEISIDGDELNIEINGDKLELSGNIDGDRWEVEADRS